MSVERSPERRQHTLSEFRRAIISVIMIEERVI